MKTKNNDVSLKKVALGMSGGVDSSLCAHLLAEQGYDVTGIYLECWRAPGCRSEEDRKDALKVALDLGIPFKVLDFKKEYKDRVVEYFFKEYESGKTPNPDVMCNKEIKFGLFYNWAMSEGFDFVATGHYGKVISEKNKSYLTIPKDTHKDQTYFLYLMTQKQLSHTLFPLGDLTKKEVRLEAKKRDLHVTTKKDSVGICFIGDINVHEFLCERLGENPGEVVDTAGNVIGEHKGLWFYTVGQRHGFEVKTKTVIRQDDGTVVDKHNIPPFYVIKKLPEKNQLMVGFGNEAFADNFKVLDVFWVNSQANKLAKGQVLVRIRHTGELLLATIMTENKDTIVKLQKPTKGIASGQSAVFYKKLNNQIICLGGGVISE